MLGALTWLFFFFILYFEVLLLIGFIARLRSAQSLSEALFVFPCVEIIVPCFNEESTITGTVRSLLALTYPSDKLHVHVVDDGSIDGTQDALKEFNTHPQVTISKKENGGKHTALNYAIERTDAEYLGCLDADSFVEPSALIESMKMFVHTDAMAVTPAIKIETPDSFFRWMQKTEYEVGILFRRIFADARAQYITPGPFSIYKKEVFDTLGPFRSAHNTEDLEMGLRMQDAGMHIENAPKSVVYTRAPRTFRPLFKQRVRWAYGFLRNAPTYRHMFFNPKNFYLGFLLLPITLITIVAAAYLPFAIGQNAVRLGIHKFTEFSTIGFAAFYFDITQIDWYILTPHTITYIIIALLSITAVLVMAGKYIGGEPLKFERGMILYLLFYGLFAPIWLSKALFDALITHKNTWR